METQTDSQHPVQHYIVFNKTFNISNVEDIYNMVNNINIKSNSMDGLDECEQVLKDLN